MLPNCFLNHPPDFNHAGRVCELRSPAPPARALWPVSLGQEKDLTLMKG